MDLKLLSQDNRNSFIEENRGFIYKTALGICKRSLNWSNDDELSIALISFNHACDTFAPEKGNFFSYSRVLIRNSLIDYFRRADQIAVLLFEERDEKLEYIDLKNSISDYERSLENKNRAEEIFLFSKELKEYNIGFTSLIESSPSHIDTRNSLLNLAFLCVREESILSYLRLKKLLPIKEIILLSRSNRKFVEKWRRYLIALILLLSKENYPYIKSYLNIKAGDKLD